MCPSPRLARARRCAQRAKNGSRCARRSGIFCRGYGGPHQCMSFFRPAGRKNDIHEEVKYHIDEENRMAIEQLQNYINGAWQHSRATELLDVRNPATNETITRVPVTPRDEVDLAAQAAQAAW